MVVPRVRLVVIDVSIGERCLASFFFNDTATTEIYTLSLHDALPISDPAPGRAGVLPGRVEHLRDLPPRVDGHERVAELVVRSEEHTSELQSRQYLVCRLLLEKKKHNTKLYSVHHLSPHPSLFHSLDA